MKALLLASLLITSAQSAFAMHAYIDIECRTTLPNGQKIKMGSSSGSYEFQVLKNGKSDTTGDNEAVNPVVIEGSKLDINTPDKSVLTLKIASESRVNKKASWQDKCWKETTETYKSQASITSISAALGKSLGLAQGQKLKLTCVEDTTAPEGKCD